MLWFIAISSFLFVVSLVFYVGQGRPTATMDERLARYQTRTLSDLSRGTPSSLFSYTQDRRATPTWGALLQSMIAQLARKLRPTFSSSYLQQVEQQLIMAGGVGKLRPIEFVTLRAVMVIVGPIVFLVLFGNKVNILLLFVSTALGWVIPDFWLKRRISERQRKITRALPDTIDLLTVSVEAGLGFDGAAQRVAERTTGPLGDEFRHYLRLVRMGTPRREAMRELGERPGVEDLKSFTTGVIQADQLGVSMSKVLRVQSEEMRRRRRQRAEETAMKAPIKMLFPLVFFIFPTIFVVLLGPAGIRIVETFMSLSRP